MRVLHITGQNAIFDIHKIKPYVILVEAQAQRIIAAHFDFIIRFSQLFTKTRKFEHKFGHAANMQTDNIWLCLTVHGIKRF